MFLLSCEHKVFSQRLICNLNQLKDDQSPKALSTKIYTHHKSILSCILFKEHIKQIEDNIDINQSIEEDN